MSVQSDKQQVRGAFCQEFAKSLHSKPVATINNAEYDEIFILILHSSFIRTLFKNGTLSVRYIQAQFAASNSLTISPVLFLEVKKRMHSQLAHPVFPWNVAS